MKRIALLLSLLLLPAVALAADTGWKSPATVTTCASGWSNCDSSFASDDKRMSHAATSTNDSYITNFSMGVTAGATIDSLLIWLEGYGDYASNCARRTVQVQFTKDGSTLVGESNTQCLDPTTDNTYTVRGVTNGLWNTTWSASDVNASSFGIAIQNTGNKADAVYIDHIQIRVYYTESGGAAKKRVIIVGGGG